MTAMQPTDNCSILTLAPYRILPATGGGHAAILQLHHHIGKLCPDHIVSTRDNDNSDAYAFDMHRYFATNPARYLPFAYQRTLKGIALKYDVQSIICEHPYMAISANALANKLGLPWYLRSHNIESERFRSLGKPWWRALARYEQWAMQKADGIFFLTEEDSSWAQQNFYINAAKCHFLPFGTVLEGRPSGKEEARKQLSELWRIDANKKWIYFLGALEYKPSEEAVAYLINEIAPRLRKSASNYQILIGGKGLNYNLQQQINASTDIQYVGFIPDLSDFLNACDIMVNPVMKGGGVKTKAVEALGYNKMVISSRSGAAGILPSICGNNLLISEDNDWDSFCADIEKAMSTATDIPEEFYETYYWGNIAEKAVSLIQGA